MVLQPEVEDAGTLRAELEAKGAKVLFGPSFQGDDGFAYGGLEDVEGNPIWVVFLAASPRS